VLPLDRCEVECVEPERVAEVVARLPAPRVFQDLAETFRVLADPGRVRLIAALLEGRNVYYALDDAHIRLLLDVALQHVAHEEPAPS
jgi:hypothetical protein